MKQTLFDNTLLLQDRRKNDTGFRGGGMILSDIEKKRVWNDLARLQDTIKLVAYQKYTSGRLYKDLEKKLDEAKNCVFDIKRKLKAVEADMDEAEYLGLELTKRLMELEE
jgi:hypothetical protein